MTDQVLLLYFCFPSVAAQGPVDRHDILREGDEILEVNGNVLVGLQHHEAVEVIKNIPSFVQVVVCRAVNYPLPGGQESDDEPGSPCSLEDPEREWEILRSLEVGVAKQNMYYTLFSVHVCPLLILYIIVIG